MNGNFGIEDFDGPQSPTRVRAAPIVMIIMAATMIGATSGVLIADRNALLLLQKDLASQFAGIRGYLLARGETAGAKPETPEVIPIGLSSVAAIRYSSKPSSAEVAFDLGPSDLVRMEKLHGPDRIFFDLKDRGRKQDTLRQLKTQKAVSIAGSLLTGVRISQRERGVTRIVLDLKRPCDFTYQTSPGPPSRLMVEIRPLPSGTAASN